MTLAVADPVGLARAALLAAATGTALAGVPIVSNKREEAVDPPYLTLSEGGDVHAGTLHAYSPARVSITAVAATDGAAAALCRLALLLLNNHAPATYTVDGVLLELGGAADETGVQQPVQEPDTSWWRAFGVIDLWMADRATS
jgi:hypothetical protein